MSESNGSKPKIGRPSSYSEVIADAICLRLSQGDSLLTISRDPHFPHRDTVHTWVHSHPEFADKYARARELQADFLAEQALELADAATNENYGAVRLAVDTRKWYAGKVHSRVYGDRPGDINVNTAVGVSVAMPESRRLELIERRRKLLEEEQPNES